MGDPGQAKRAFCDRGQQVLRESGLKVTPQRSAILEVYCGPRGHWTAQELFGHLENAQPSMSLATVYNTLETFAEIGLLKPLLRPDGQTVFDRNTSSHHHVICVTCQTIIDVAIPHEAVAGLLDSAPSIPEFEVEAADVWYRGRCKRCQ